ncbi:MAG: glycosyltransferase family 9 protein [Pirellulales bacterium]|nr:glycosyltransferase family 9 protein [Pirellulales bacterium]
MTEPRFLIVRLSAIGDVIQALPLACALRDHFPRAYIAWAVEGRAGSLLEGHSAINELIPLQRGWLKSPRGVWRLWRHLRSRRFDVALEAQGLLKAAILARLSGARRRIGFGKPWGRELTPWLNTEVVDTGEVHIIERNLRLLHPLGIASPAVRFDLPEHEADRRAAGFMLQAIRLGGPFALINPGAGWPSKLWPTARYAAVAEYLANKWDLPALVVWAGPAERRLAEEIAAAAPGHVRLAPETTLGQLAALARRARLFIGSDTGPLHLAAATGTPCVGLYGPWPAKRHGPFGPRHVCVQKAFFEGPTRRRRHAPKTYMEAIQIDDVCRACEVILCRRRLLPPRVA